MSLRSKPSFCCLSNPSQENHLWQLSLFNNLSLTLFLFLSLSLSLSLSLTLSDTKIHCRTRTHTLTQTGSVIRSTLPYSFLMIFSLYNRPFSVPKAAIWKILCSLVRPLTNERRFLSCLTQNLTQILTQKVFLTQTLEKWLESLSSWFFQPFEVVRFFFIWFQDKKDFEVLKLTCLVETLILQKLTNAVRHTRTHSLQGQSQSNTDSVFLFLIILPTSVLYFHLFLSLSLSHMC